MSLAFAPHVADLPKVEHTEDWARVQALPIRAPDLESMRARGEELSAELTPLLRRGDALDKQAKLKWIQALALWEIFQGRGAYLGIPVGGGKTLISWLAAYILEAQRPVLILPESLFNKTRKEFHKYAQTWVAPPAPITLVGCKSLTREENVDLLSRMFDGEGPDFVFIDECDLIRNQDGSAAKRLDRFKVDSQGEDGPDEWPGIEPGAELEGLPEHEREAVLAWCKAKGVPFICATGTGTRFSILDFTHFMCWAREHAAPVPLDPDEVARWANALDEKSKGRPEYSRRLRAGALLDLIELPAELRAELREYGAGELGYARATFMHRLRSTPGVLITDEDDCDQPLTFRLVCAPEDPRINDAFDKFRKEWELPNGQEIIDGLEVWRTEFELGAGGFNFWKPPPPEVWSNARRAYGKRILSEIRRTAYSADPKDTAKAVAKAFPNDPIIERWREVKPLFNPDKHREWQWLSASVVNYAARWAREQVGTVWVQSIAVGEAIAAAAGIKFYGAQGLSADGSDIEYAPGDRSLVAGILSNSRGRNLQDRFSRGLAVQCPQSGDQCQQLFGRLHRFGQGSPVHWDILITSGGSRYAWDMATREATFVMQTQSQRQKILRGDIQDCIFPSDALRWARKAA